MVLKTLANDLMSLFKKETELARSDMSDKIYEVQNGLTSLVISAIVLFFGLQFILTAIVLGLSNVIAPWLSSLIVGMALAVIGGVLVVMARRKLQVKNHTIDPFPRRLHNCST